MRICPPLLSVRALLSHTMMMNEKVIEHDLCCAFATSCPPAPMAALVVLNSESFSAGLLSKLWRSCGTRICADGGANRLYDLAPELVPDAIVGDLDSVRLDVRRFYLERGVRVEKMDDQEHNDLDKSIGEIQRLWHSETVETTPLVSIVGAFGGRLDQEMATFDAVYRWADRWPGVAFRMYTDHNAATLLTPNVRHFIRFRPDLEGPSCGLVPIGHKVDKVTTTGLKWNLSGDPLEFGKLISTSNQLDDENDGIVSVSTSDPIIWTTPLRPAALRID